LGPGDHGRTLTSDQFTESEYELGYQYELIEGRLYVTPSPNQPHDWIEQFIFTSLLEYSRQHADAINRVTNNARVFVPGTTWTTAPKPDVVAYREFPTDQQRNVAWEEVSPILVVEIISPSDPDKDLVRNVDLYRQVPSIQEYWVLDNRQDAARPTMRVFRRAGDGWATQDVAFGETYTTPLLPEFSLVVDPGQQ
jgi:Uma2 family endonuclease